MSSHHCNKTQPHCPTPIGRRSNAVPELDGKITLKILIDLALASHQNIYPLLQKIKILGGPKSNSSPPLPDKDKRVRQARSYKPRPFADDTVLLIAESSHSKFESLAESELKGSDGILQYCTRTRVPLFGYSYSYSQPLVLG